MYKIKFNTKEFNNRKRRDWENQLMNDFAVAINGKEFICNSDLDLENRLSFISGSCYSSKNEDEMAVWNQYEKDENNYFQLTNDRYNTQRLKYGMYGIAQGYVSFDKVLEGVKLEKRYKIPFNAFYDLRQGNFFKGCYIEIIVE